ERLVAGQAISRANAVSELRDGQHDTTAASRRTARDRAPTRNGKTGSGLRAAGRRDSTEYYRAGTRGPPVDGQGPPGNGPPQSARRVADHRRAPAAAARRRRA